MTATAKVWKTRRGLGFGVLGFRRFRVQGSWTCRESFSAVPPIQAEHPSTLSPQRVDTTSVYVGP